MTTFKAAILEAHNAPLVITDLNHEPTDHNGKTCAPGQVRVSVSVSGICGAQLGEIRGEKNGDAPTPRLLGHEGCGIVREVGAGVNAQLVGQKCVLHWREGDGPKAFYPARYSTGNLKTIGGGHITTFTQSAVVSANRVTPVPNDVLDEVCALMGCSLSTALGTIEQEAKLRFGETVLILGCGGVGLNLIIAAGAAGAGHITVVDKDVSKATLALGAGAESFVDLPLIKDRRYDVIVDTTGVASVIEEAMTLLSGTGRMVLVGQTKKGEGFMVKSAVDRFYGEGSRIIWTQGGGFRPSQDIPRYVRLWQSGRLKLDAVVSHRVPLEKINDGLELVRAGQAGRVLVDCK